MKQAENDGVAAAIDLGTSNTVAVVRGPDGRTRPLLLDGQPIMPSGVYLDGEGVLQAGWDAYRLAQADLSRYLPNPKRSIDEETVVLGGRELETTELLAAILRVVAAAAEQACGVLPDATLTYPATWGQPRRQVLQDAARRANWHTVRLVAEPIAAARYFTHVLRRPVPVGSSVAVFDFGGGTVDVAVVRNDGPRYTVLESDGLADLGGLDIDAALVSYLAPLIQQTAPQVWQRLAEPSSASDWRSHRLFWNDIRGAKETLSRRNEAPVPIPGIDQPAILTRDQLEQIAAPLLQRAVRLTAAVVRRCRLKPEQLAGVFLVGGSSRIPLVARMLHQELGMAPTVLEQPEVPVAEGALTELSVNPGAGDSDIPTGEPTAAAVPLNAPSQPVPDPQPAPTDPSATIPWPPAEPASAAPSEPPSPMAVPSPDPALQSVTAPQYAPVYQPPPPWLSMGPAEHDPHTPAVVEPDPMADAFPRAVPPLGDVYLRRPRWRRLLPFVAGACALVLVLVGVVLVATGRHRPPADDRKPAVPLNVWRQLPDLPRPLEAAAVAAFGNKLYVVGGIAPDNGRPLLASVEIFDPATNRWSAGPDLPAAVDHAALVSNGRSLYLIGGLLADGSTSTVLRLDAGPAATWQPDIPLPAPRGAGAAAWDGSRIVFAGGVRPDHQGADNVWALRDGRWTEIGKLQRPREQLAAVTDGAGTTWFLGGRDPQGPEPRELDAVDSVTGDTVTASSDRVPPRTGAAAVRVSGGPRGVCLLGGASGSEVFPTFSCLGGPDGGGLPNLLVARAGHGAARIGNTIYVVGGYGNGFSGTTKVEAMTVKG